MPHGHYLCAGPRVSPQKGLVLGHAGRRPCPVAAHCQGIHPRARQNWHRPPRQPQHIPLHSTLLCSPLLSHQGLKFPCSAVREGLFPYSQTARLGTAIALCRDL